MRPRSWAILILSALQVPIAAAWRLMISTRLPVGVGCGYVIAVGTRSAACTFGRDVAAGSCRRLVRAISGDGAQPEIVVRRHRQSSPCHSGFVMFGFLEVVLSGVLALLDTQHRQFVLVVGPGLRLHGLVLIGLVLGDTLRHGRECGLGRGIRILDPCGLDLRRHRPKAAFVVIEPPASQALGDAE